MRSTASSTERFEVGLSLPRVRPTERPRESLPAQPQAQKHGTKSMSQVADSRAKISTAGLPRRIQAATLEYRTEVHGLGLIAKPV